MAKTEAKVYGDRWRVVRQLGRGGQGTVYEVQDVSTMPTRADLALQVKSAFLDIEGELHMASPNPGAFDKFLTLISAISTWPQTPRAALKELLPFDQDVDRQRALDRMKTELETLRAVKHPALISVLDDKLEDGWFVTQYFARGTVENRLAVYRGRVLDALRAFRPIVDAVAALHEKGIVHRDIKPANVFCDDAGQLVLGDCGLAIRLDNTERVTMTLENVGSRDWMPGWAQGMRLEDVRPTFDVFSLGKLLWSMVSGVPKLQLWYFKRPQFDVSRMFPESTEIDLVTRILEKSVVEDEKECALSNAGELRSMVDQAILALKSGGQVPSRSRPLRCHFCGYGTYQRELTQDGFADPKDRRHSFRCDHCGHIAVFHWRNDEAPPGWVG